MAVHDVVDLIGVDGFILHQGFHHQLELVAISLKNFLRLAVTGVDNLAHFFIDRLCSIAREILRLRRSGASEEHLAFVFRIQQRAEFGGQTPLGHHIARHLGCTLNVVGGSSCDPFQAERHFLGDAAAVKAADLAQNSALA